MKVFATVCAVMSAVGALYLDALVWLYAAMLIDWNAFATAARTDIFLLTWLLTGAISAWLAAKGVNGVKVKV